MSVTAVIPTYNRADYIVGAVQSVLDQTVHTEVIVVDDASTDDTVERLAEFGSRIRIIVRDENGERGAARNLGARQAPTEYVAFLDSDDEWRPDKIELQLGLIGVSPLAAVMSGLEYIDADGTCIGSYTPPVDGVGELASRNPYLGSGSSMLLRRDVFCGIGGYPEDRGLQGSEDWLLLHKLKDAGVDFQVMPMPLVRCRFHMSNSTGDPANVARSMWQAVEWLESGGYVRGADQRRLRTMTAMTIARMHARNRQRGTAEWLRRALLTADLPSGIRALWGVALSAVRGLFAMGKSH